MKLIIGLGNPGEEYKGTRHNLGRDLLSAAAEKLGFGEFKEDKTLRALIAKGKIGKSAALAVLPQTFMNNSGQTVKKIQDSRLADGQARFKIKAEDVVIIHDDLDLPLGALKISQGKSAGGHRGVASVLKALKSKDAPRIRVGISPKKSASWRTAKRVNDFILKKFTPSELKTLSKLKKQLPEILEVIASESPQKAMSLYN